jgi:ABC-type lipoprotein export system ATPase subunit
LCAFRFKGKKLNTYLKKAKLGGYRTIRNVEAEFNPGLNIIIGKNGSGKTNFLSFISKVLSLDFKALGVFYAEIDLGGEHGCTISASRGKEIFKKRGLLHSLQMANPKILYKAENKAKIFTSSSEFQKAMPLLLDDVQLIPHGISEKGFDVFISTPFAFSVSILNGASDDLLVMGDDEKQSRFTSSIFTSLLFQLHSLSNGSYPLTSSILETAINFTFDDFVDNLNLDIEGYLPIEKIRLSPGYKFYEDLENSLIRVEGLILDFYANGSWLPFSSLSDGTKRLFYIYAEMIISGYFDNRLKLMPAKDKIILLEEPELGIHPHQFHLVMQLLKRISENNQLIVTTHAPQALNIIGTDELNAINICSFSSDEGTVLKRLTKTQIEKAKFYMEDMYLSDYWMNSDLEK